MSYRGQEIEPPVRVSGAAGAAVFLVGAADAQDTIAYSGLDIVELPGGRAACALFFVDYLGGVLGRYHEFGVGFLARSPGGRRPGVHIHRLPVDGSRTLAAGRRIWGFPKTMADIDLRRSTPYQRCIVHQEGRLVIDMLLKPGLPVPAPGARVPLTAFSHLNGATRRIRWDMAPYGIRGRPGGALLRLGDHPIAAELRGLGLPGSAAAVTTMRHVAMTFHEAETIG
ncbi:MAG: acetoacetate decarboxylase family protein [Nocardiopsaceae bacterium]|nr:acetoacetate decarboxylase family protein [Nocardiopsaceae bacterium]